ncbi:MAG: deoxyribose-phosphate aldolase [Anaerolineales bacterium]|nr:deoxyribose-phosphate aldolase [Anaerolineales bacterium]
MDLGALLDLADKYVQELPPLVSTPQEPRGEQIAAYIDHTLLKPEATAEQVKSLCQEARQHRFAAVCVNPVYLPLARGLLESSGVKLCAVVGFPLGASMATQKAFEALACLEAGATEIDMVMAIGALKGEAYGQVLNDIQGVVQVAHNQGAIVKVILETAALTLREKVIACLLSKEAGADFVKTSTGFGAGGATVEDVALMARVVAGALKVKAAGGIRSYSDALGMIRAGAARIGTSSGVRILQEALA